MTNNAFQLAMQHSDRRHHVNEILWDSPPKVTRFEHVDECDTSRKSFNFTP